MDTLKHHSHAPVPAPSWHVLFFAGQRYYALKRHIRPAGVVLYSVFEPSRIDGPHAAVESHPEHGVLGRLGSQRFPGSDSAVSVGREQRDMQIAAARDAFRSLATSVLTASFPELAGQEANPDCQIEITLH